jgi:carbonic anhydrase
MSLLSDILTHNDRFVASKEYEAYLTDRFPNKKLVIVTCMDTRLVELLPHAMNLRQGDVKIVKVAGAIVSHPFGSVMRSILVAVYDLGAAEVAIVGHHNCGMAGLSCARVLDKAKQRGVSDEVLTTLRHGGIDLEKWLTGFETVESGVLESVQSVRRHPLMPKDVPVHGLIICPETGRLEVLADGYSDSKSPGAL